MNQLKNKILLGSVGIMMIVGISYQNCGQIKQENVSSSAQQGKTFISSSNALMAGADTSNGKFIVVMKDGTRVLYEYPTQSKIYKIHLKDGRVIEYTAKTW